MNCVTDFSLKHLLFWWWEWAVASLAAASDLTHLCEAMQVSVFVCECKCAQVTFGQVKSQEAREADHGYTGVEVRRRVTEELVHIWKIEQGGKDGKKETMAERLWNIRKQRWSRLSMPLQMFLKGSVMIFMIFQPIYDTRVHYLDIICYLNNSFQAQTFLFCTVCI